MKVIRNMDREELYKALGVRPKMVKKTGATVVMSTGPKHNKKQGLKTKNNKKEE